MAQSSALLASAVLSCDRPEVQLLGQGLHQVFEGGHIGGEVRPLHKFCSDLRVLAMCPEALDNWIGKGFAVILALARTCTWSCTHRCSFAAVRERQARAAGRIPPSTVRPSTLWPPRTRLLTGGGARQ